MRAFNYNIKLIRVLSGKNQKEFADLIKSKESNIKTWETTKSVPRNHLIYRRIAEIAGVGVDDIKNKKLEEKDISLKVEIVEDNTPLITPKQYIQELQDDKKRLIASEQNIMSQLVANSTAMMQLLNVLQRHDQAFHETILKSLSRIEGGNIDLVLEAHKYEAALQMKDSKQDSNVGSGK